MKSFTLSQVAVASVACLVAAPLARAEGEIALSDSPRQNITADKSFVVTTTKIGTEYPIATKPQFSLDCSQTDGWTVDAMNVVSKVPDLGGGSRYITSASADIKYSNYAQNLWYNSVTKNKIGGPTLKPADDTIKGPYLDFGAKGSRRCLFFDPSEMVDEVAWNKLTNVGTVIGVFKSNEGGGQILGGQDFKREARDGTTAILFKHSYNDVNTSKAAKNGREIWQGRQYLSADCAYWGTGWEVIAYTPTDATLLEAHGVGVGNCHGADSSSSSGGQAIAELMIFDTVLPVEDVQALVAHLEKKWIPGSHSGEEGVGRVAALNLSDSSVSPDVGKVATVDVPADETLTVDQMRGGRASSGSTLPALVKTGAGALTVNDAADFGGEVKLENGTLAFASRSVPTFGQLPAGMTFRLDASDTSTMALEDDAVADWTNHLWSTRSIRAYANVADHKPRLVRNALGEGLNVVDFGCREDGTWSHLKFDKVPRFVTVVAFVDARIQGGGHLTDNIRRNSTWPGRTVSFTDKFFGSDSDRTKSQIWVNGRHNDALTEGYEVPASQVVAIRLPAANALPTLLGSRQATTTGSDAGGLRLGEFIAYERALSEEEVRDVSAYLMKKWLGRTAPGYANVSGSGVADLQRVVAAADTVIDVPEGATKTIAKLTAVGAVVKTGAGKLVLGNGSDIAGGFVVREGSVGRTAGTTVAADTPAKDPILHLDATEIASYYSWSQNGTNFVAAWQSRDGKSGAYTQETAYNRFPFLNTWDTLNGHPVVDFGKQVDSYSNTDGAFFRIAPEVRNLRAAYVVYGSQAKGGQIFGSKSGTTADLGRSTTPTLDTPLFNNACDDFQAGEVYTNGVRIAAGQNRTFKPTGGYQLIEIHPKSGLRFNALGTGGTPHYLHGGCRMGEVIVYERPLTEREKVATRNYLLKKWFPETPLAELPDEPEIEPLAGSLSYDAGATWNVAVAADGTTADNMAVTGTLAFGANAKISLTGLTAFTEEQLKSLKVVIAKAGAYEGLDDVSVTGDVEFTRGTQPRLVARANGDLVVRFGQSGLVVICH